MPNFCCMPSCDGNKLNPVGPETITMLDAIKILIPVVIIGVALLYVFQDALIFFPQPVPPQNQAPFAEYALTLAHEGKQLQGWYVPGKVSANRPLVVYYGGNAEEVSGNLWDMARLEAGAYLFMNYRGYGDSEGKPSQKNLCRDALYILDTLAAREQIPLNHVVLMGRSLGSGVAVHVAAHRPVRGVILVTPFDSLLNVARRHYPILPVRWLLKHPFDSAALAPDISIPALILIGRQDTIIPSQHAIRLSEVWGGPVESIIIDGVGHNDIQLEPRYWEVINAFLSTGKAATTAPSLPTTNKRE
jgi:pimeloyl-ACP methyl ester carboxylesterase